MALLDNHRRAARMVPAIGDALDVPKRAGKQLLQTGKYLLNEGIGAATGVKIPGVKATAEPIFGGVADHFANIGEMVKEDMLARGAVPVQAQPIDAAPGQTSAGKKAAAVLGPAELPNDFVKEKGGVQNAMDAVTGTASSAAPETAPVSETKPPVQPVDGGSGFAVVDGNRINYRDIGATGVPSKTAVSAIPAIDAPADPNIGAMDREVKRIQGVQDQANLAGIGIMSPQAAVRDITLRQTQQGLDQRGQALTADAAQKDKALAINAPLIDAQAKKYLSDAAVNEFAYDSSGNQVEASHGPGCCGGGVQR